MTKFAVLLVAIVAFQAVMADHQQQRRQVQDILRRMKDMTKEVTDNIERIQVDDNPGRRFITLLANDFTHTVQNVVFNLQQTAELMQDETNRTVKQAAGKLGESAFSIHQAMNSEPTKMKAQLKIQIQTVCDEVEELKHIVDEQSQDDKRNTNDEIKKAISDLAAATTKVHIQILFKTVSHRGATNEILSATDTLPMYVDSITTFDEQTAKDLAHHARHFAHMVYEMVDKLEGEGDKQKGDIKAQFHYIAKKMVGVCVMLEKASITGGNAQTRITQMKSKFVDATEILANQGHSLFYLVKDNVGDEWMVAVVKRVSVDAVSSLRIVKTGLAIVGEQNKH